MSELRETRNAAGGALDVCVLQPRDGGLVIGVPIPGDTLCPLRIIVEPESFRGVVSERGSETELFSFDTMKNVPLRDALTRCLNKARNTRRDPAIVVWRTDPENMRVFGNVSFDIRVH